MRNVITLASFLFCLSISAQKAFITTWEVSSDLSMSVTIPTGDMEYDYTVDWGDGNITSNQTKDVTHLYSEEGTYRVSITGVFPWFYSKSTSTREQLLSIDQWGDQEWKSMEQAFDGCENMTYNATDAPNLSGVTSMKSMFSKAYKFNGDIGNWNVSNVTNMSRMFKYAHVFNQDIGNWNVSNVTNMSQLFKYAHAFNQDLGNWNVGNVTNMSQMFSRVETFNQDIGNWDVSNVTDMSSMFTFAHAFNQNIGNWDVSNVKDMSSMFNRVWTFNQDIGNWNVSNVTNMSRMFVSANAFNQDIGNWNVSNVTNMSWMLASANAFNQNIGNWDVSNVTDMSFMFTETDAFNQNIGNWDVGKVTEISGMFSSANSFNQDIGNWDVSNVLNMSNMFRSSILSTKNYDKILISWASSNPKSEVSLGAEGISFCKASFARQHLIDNFGWEISDAGQTFSCGDSEVKIISYFEDESTACDDKTTPIPYLKYNVTNDENISITPISNQNGELLPFLYAGTYTIKPILNNSDQFIITPESITVNVTFEEEDLEEIFCIQANNQFTDISISIIPLNIARPGFDVSYKLILRNNGTEINSGKVEFSYPSDVMSFLEATPFVTEEQTDLLVWEYTDLIPFSSKEFFVDFNINSPMDTPPVNGGDILAFKATAFPLDTDLNRIDNIASLNQEVVNSFDPNDKTCLEGSILLEEMIGEYLHYMIRFENTGTADAINVRVEDVIDINRFDISTLELIDASHEVQVVIDRDEVEFVFDNINLPFEDETNDGYVVFKIKTLDHLVIGDAIENTAEIFFDFNYPIITNTAITTVEELSHTQELYDNIKLELYPNPTRSEISISAQENIVALIVYNLQGQVLQNYRLSGNQKYYPVDVASLQSGTYFLKVISEEGGSAMAQFVKL